MASQPRPISVDWTKIEIWCCGQYLHVDDIAEHATQMHSEGGNGVNDEDSKNKSKETPLSVNVLKNNDNINFGTNNNSENYLRKGEGLKDNNKYYCDSCEYKSTHKYNLRVHIENKHLGIRHQCEMCQFRSTTKQGLNRHKIRIHIKKEEMNQELSITDTLQETATTETASLFQNGLMDEAEIKQKILDITPKDNVSETHSIVHNEQADIANIKQENESETPSLLENEENEMLSVAVSLLTEVKEEADEKNLQVPRWRIFPEFESLPLNDRVDTLTQDEREKSRNIFLEEQAVIEKLHAKLEKNEKNIKRWDAQWRKRQVELEKLKLVKGSYSGKDIKKEEDIQLVWPNPDYITDLVVYEEEKQEQSSMASEGQYQSSVKKSPSE